MITAENVTDEQILQLLDESLYGSETYRAALDALHTLDAISEPARARCAEILNARGAK